MELGSHGITVNAVAPGFVRTDMTQGRRSKEEWEVLLLQLGLESVLLSSNRCFSLSKCLSNNSFNSSRRNNISPNKCLSSK